MDPVEEFLKQFDDYKRSGAQSNEIGTYTFPVGYELSAAILLSFLLPYHFNKAAGTCFLIQITSHTRALFRTEMNMNEFFFSTGIQNLESFHDNGDATFSENFDTFSKFYKWNPFHKVFKIKNFPEIPQKIFENKALSLFTSVLEEPFYSTFPPKTVTCDRLTFNLQSFICFKDFSFYLYLHQFGQLIEVSNCYRNEYLVQKDQFKRDLYNSFLVACTYEISVLSTKIPYQLPLVSFRKDFCFLTNYDFVLTNFLKMKRDFLRQIKKRSQIFSSILKDYVIYSMKCFDENPEIMAKDICFRNWRFIDWASEFISEPEDEQVGKESLMILFGTLPLSMDSFEGRYAYPLTIWKCKHLCKSDHKCSYKQLVKDYFTSAFGSEFAQKHEMNGENFISILNPVFRKSHFEKYTLRMIGTEAEKYYQYYTDGIENPFDLDNQDLIRLERLKETFQVALRWCTWPMDFVDEIFKLMRDDQEKKRYLITDPPKQTS